MVRMLLRAGADVKATNGYLSTPLHLACDELFEKVDADNWAAKDRAALLRAGGVEEESDEEMEGEANGFEEVVGLLLRAGADTEARDRSENTPLLLAVEAGGVVVAPYVAGVIKRLLAANADTEARSHKKNGALHLAARLGDATVVEMLLDAGANAATGRNKFQTPLHMVCSNSCRGFRSCPPTTLDDEKVAKLLLDAGADTAVKDREGRSPLHLALSAQRENIVQFLLAAGADATAPTSSDGCTPLHRARSATVVRLLLDAGGSALATNRRGDIPRDGVPDLPQIAAMLWAAEQKERRRQCLTFAMGHHERLGAASLVRGLEPEVLRIVLTRLCKCNQAPWCVC